VRFSPLVDRIAGEETGAWRVHAEGVRRGAGHEVIFLTVGDPDQAAPAPVLYATIEALRRNRTGYSPIIGYPQVRTAIAARTHKRTGVKGPPPGWPTDEKTEALRAAWFAATDEARRHDLADQIQQRAFEFVPYIPTGQLVGRRAFRQNLAGVLDAPLPFLWNIEKR
jgi:ABC-type transport system substrate-binding protein